MDYVMDKTNNLNPGKQNREILLNPSNSLMSEKVKDLLCFSHLRWNLVFQRPQHLLTRFAKEIRVFYFEEPIFEDHIENYLELSINREYANVYLLTPHIRHGYNELQVSGILKDFVDTFIQVHQVKDFLLWYLTPMSLPFTRHLHSKITIYDCMDELSGFKGAHPQMLQFENMLMNIADTVFTGGYSLYEHKKSKHFNIHPFPSSIDKIHFENGYKSKDPDDQKNIPHPRVGFYGVIDERMDIRLLDGLAREMPDTHFIIIGPVVKIDENDLPKYPNIHYLGSKKYAELPAYLAYWDVAFLPFAKNESTRYISPTKTPEYLCAGKPVVSTSIHDVVDPYGKVGLVHIADAVNDFTAAIRKSLDQKDDQNWKAKTSAFLSTNSWDITFTKMKKIILETLEMKEALNGKAHRIVSESLSEKITGSPDIKIRIR